MAVIASRVPRHQACDRTPGALVPALVLGMLLAAGSSAALEVAISADIESVTVAHDGERLVVQRNQDRRNTIAPYYAFTSRPCPPFCIQLKWYRGGMQSWESVGLSTVRATP